MVAVLIQADGSAGSIEAEESNEEGGKFQFDKTIEGM